MLFGSVAFRFSRQILIDPEILLLLGELTLRHFSQGHHKGQVDSVWHVLAPRLKGAPRFPIVIPPHEVCDEVLLLQIEFAIFVLDPTQVSRMELKVEEFALVLVIWCYFENSARPYWFLELLDPNELAHCVLSGLITTGW